MPDVKLADRYQKRLLRAEATYARRLRQGMRHAKRRMINQIAGQDLSTIGERYRVAQSFKGVLVELKGDLSDARNVAADSVIKATRSYLVPQVALVQSVVQDAPDIAALFSGAAIIELEAYFGVDWIDTWGSRIAQEIRLMGEVSEADLIQMLFADGLVDGRASVYRHAVNSAALDANLSVFGYGSGLINGVVEVGNRLKKSIYQKQVIAGLDERTTQTCLMAHGQIVSLKGKFVLRGTPRFRDEMDHVPFHWNCRSSIALWHPAFEEVGLRTGEMKGAARAELKAREAGRVEIHPAHARSKRS